MLLSFARLKWFEIKFQFLNLWCGVKLLDIEAMKKISLAIDMDDVRCETMQNESKQ